MYMMKPYTDNSGDSRKFKFLPTFLLLAILILSCERLPQYDLPEYEVFNYKEGDTIVFESAASGLNYLVIDEVSLEYQADNQSSSLYEFQNQKITQHFLHEEILIAMSDSLIPLNTQCKISSPFAVCDSLYNYRRYDMRISIVAKAAVNKFSGVGERFVIWKNHWFHDVDYRNIGDLEINGKTYKNVFEILRDDSMIDSIRPMKAIYFNNRFGIVKYEMKGDEVFEFLEVR